ncbi:hypothetical protein NHJ6243_009855, partial [Beauveria neobassiana]
MACRLTDVAATSKAGSSPLQTLAQLAAQPSTTEALDSPALGSTKATKGAERRWVCKICTGKSHHAPAHFHASGLQNAKNHLFEKHAITAPSGEGKSAKQKRMESGHAKGGFRSIADMMKLDPLKPKEQALSNHIIKSFNRTHFQNLLMEWIVGNNLAFATVEHKELQAIFEYLNPSVRICGANLTADSIRSRVLSAFKEHKDKVVEVLQRSPGLVHLSFDGWRSGNRLALYGIACFYRDESNKPCKIAIGVPELSSRHSGANIAIQILDVIDQYAIRDKVGYFTLDNAENNDTAMDEIGKDLGFDGRMRRGRCFGHILNLSAKALLFGKNLGAFETELTGEALLAEAEYELWQKRGPVGKIHNIVAEIH